MATLQHTPKQYVHLLQKAVNAVPKPQQMRSASKLYSSPYKSKAVTVPLAGLIINHSCAEELNQHCPSSVWET